MDELDESYRLTGLVDPGGFVRAMSDGRTVVARIGDGPELPLLAPVEHVAGYDVERCRRLAGSDDVMVLTLPFEALASGDLNMPVGDRPAPGAIMVETDHGCTADVQQALPGMLAGLGSYEPREFIDERIRSPERRTAHMAVYQGRFEALDNEGQPLPARGIGFAAAYQELLDAGSPLTKRTRLLSAQELQDNDDLVRQLCELCRGRFDWLGEQHPVSMEDTEEFFLQLLLDDNTHMLVRYDDEGHLACMGFFMSGLQSCEWMKQKYRDAEMNAAAERGDQVMYFHGIASNSTKAARYSYDVVSLLVGVCRGMGGVHSVDFESTGMSGGYIPRIVMGGVGENVGMRVVEPVAKTTQIDYWLLTPTKVGVTS